MRINNRIKLRPSQIIEMDEILFDFQFHTGRYSEKFYPYEPVSRYTVMDDLLKVVEGDE